MHLTSVITTVVVLFVALSVDTRIPSEEPPHAQSPSEQPHLKLILNDAKETYAFGDDVRLKVTMENQSDQPANVAVIDTYYQNRPKLLRNGKIVGYEPKVTQLVNAKDVDTVITRLAFVSIDPYSSGKLPSLNLSEWYGKLEPGSYRLTNKYRISFDGPWTKEAAEVQFRIVKEQ